MDSRTESYISMSISFLACSIFSWIAASHTLNNLFVILVCVFGGILVMTVCLGVKHHKKRKNSYKDYVDDCVFLLKTYDITDNNRDIVIKYLKYIHSEIKFYVSFREAKILNYLMKQKRISAVTFYDLNTTPDILEALGLGCISFALGSISACAIRYIFFNASLSILFWISLGLLALGGIISVFCIGDTDNHKIMAIVVAGIAVFLVAVVLIYPGIDVDREKNMPHETTEHRVDTDTLSSITSPDNETEPSENNMSSIESTYLDAISLYEAGNYEQAIEKFQEIYDYRDSADLILKCQNAIQDQILESDYLTAQKLYNDKDYGNAYTSFLKLIDYKESQFYLNKILKESTELAESYANNGEYSIAYELLASVGYTTSKYSTSYSSLMDACNSALYGNYKLAVTLGLTKIVLPDGMQTIHSYMFENCQGLVEIVMPDSVTTIEAYAFSGCTSLSKITFSNNVTSIGRSAFANCDAINQLILPISLESIVTYGLNSIDGEIHYEGTISQWEALKKNSMGSVLRKNIYCKDGIVFNEEE